MPRTSRTKTAKSRNSRQQGPRNGDSRKRQSPATPQPAPKRTRRTTTTVAPDDPRPLTTADIPAIVNAVLDARHGQPPVERDVPPAPSPDQSADVVAIPGNQTATGNAGVSTSTNQATSEEPSDFGKLFCCVCTQLRNSRD